MTRDMMKEESEAIFLALNCATPEVAIKGTSLGFLPNALKFGVLRDLFQDKKFEERFFSPANLDAVSQFIVLIKELPESDRTRFILNDQLLRKDSYSTASLLQKFVEDPRYRVLFLGSLEDFLRADDVATILEKVDTLPTVVKPVAVGPALAVGEVPQLMAEESAAVKELLDLCMSEGEDESIAGLKLAVNPNRRQGMHNLFADAVFVRWFFYSGRDDIVSMISVLFKLMPEDRDKEWFLTTPMVRNDQGKVVNIWGMVSHCEGMSFLLRDFVEGYLSVAVAERICKVQPQYLGGGSSLFSGGASGAEGDGWLIGARVNGGRRV